MISGSLVSINTVKNSTSFLCAQTTGGGVLETENRIALNFEGYAIRKIAKKDRNLYGNDRIVTFIVWW